MLAGEEADLERLFTAIERQSPEELSALIGDRADINRQDAHGLSPLMLAVSQGREDLVRILLKAGASVNARGEGGVTPLHEACFGREKRAIVKRLLVAGASIDARDELGRTPLIHAVSGGPGVVKTLLDHGADPDLTSKEGECPLSICAEDGLNASALRLMESGADVNWREPETNSSLLFLAADVGAHKIVTMLLEAGADPNLPTHEGETPLMRAIGRDHLEIALSIAERGCDTSQTFDGFTALDFALETEDRVKRLVEFLEREPGDD